MIKYNEVMSSLKEIFEKGSKDELVQVADIQPFKTAIFRFGKTAEEFSNHTIPDDFMIRGILAVMNDATNEIFEEGTKAIAWYSRKNGKYGDYLNTPFPAQVELYAYENNCTVYQAVARLTL